MTTTNGAYELGFIVPSVGLGQLFSNHQGVLTLVKYNTKWIVKSHYSHKSGTVFQAFLRGNKERITEMDEALRVDGYRVVRSRKL